MRCKKDYLNVHKVGTLMISEVENRKDQTCQKVMEHFLKIWFTVKETSQYNWRIFHMISIKFQCKIHDMRWAK